MTRARDLADSADKDIAGTITLDAVNASGVITGLTVEATGDTAAGDNAAMGYTAAEGLILTGQGSSGDITIKNDADAVVLQVPTGTTNVNVIGSIDVATNAVIDGTALVTGVLTTTAATVHNGGITMPDGAIAKFGTDADLQISHINGTGSLIRQGGEGNLFIQGSDSIVFGAGDGSETLATFTDDGGCTLNFNNAAKIATTNTGVTVTGNIANASGNLTITAASGLILDAAADITLDAGGSDFYFAENSTTMGRIGLENGDMNIAVHRSDYDIAFHAIDNGTAIVPVKIQGDLTITEFIASANTTIAPAIQLSNPNAGNAGDGTAMWFALSRDGGYQFRNSGQIAVIKEQDWTSTASTVDGSMTFSTMLNENLTEHGRFTSAGRLLIGKVAASNTVVGIDLSGPQGQINSVTTDAGGAQQNIFLNRQDSDGTFILFRKANGNLGSIKSVSSGFEIHGIGTNHCGWSFRNNSAILPIKNSTITDNLVDLGNASYRMDDIFATNGTIQTSDRNEKQDIASLTSAEMLVAKRISALFKTFRWKDKVAAKGDDARTHSGIVAQDVQASFAAENLDAGDYSMFISTTWWEHDVDVAAVQADDTVNPPIEAADAYTRTDTYDTEDEAPEGSTSRTRLGIRYPELLSFLAAYNEQRFAAIETRLTALEG